jgi:hypothetical protein
VRTDRVKKDEIEWWLFDKKELFLSFAVPPSHKTLE